MEQLRLTGLGTVSDCSIPPSSGKDGKKRRELYHPNGREKDVTYIHASRFRIPQIYMDLKLGAILDGRGRVIGYTYRGAGATSRSRRS